MLAFAAPWRQFVRAMRRHVQKALALAVAGLMALLLVAPHTTAGTMPVKPNASLAPVVSASPCLACNENGGSRMDAACWQACPGAACALPHDVGLQNLTESLARTPRDDVATRGLIAAPEPNPPKSRRAS